MCGIVGAVADRDIVPVLIEGLRRLEYRGYDSAGVAVLNGSGHIKRLRTVGKVKKLQDALDTDPTHGGLGIAHTRWPRTACRASATPTRTSPRTASRSSTTASSRTTRSCEPRRSARLRVHLRDRHRGDRPRIHHHLQVTGDLFKAVRATVAELEGATRSRSSRRTTRPHRVARQGCPVVIGLGEHENFVASDVAALLPVTRNFVFLEEATWARSAATACASSTATATPRSARPS